MMNLTPLLCFAISSASAWTSQHQGVVRHQQTKSLAFVSTALKAVQKGGNGESEQLRENPCWQDLYDDDCTEESMYGANFVAAEWIKKLPCASGLEDCDMPADLNLPGNRQDSGEEVDVLGFLKLKRAESVNKKSEKSKDDNVAP